MKNIVLKTFKFVYFMTAMWVLCGNNVHAYYIDPSAVTYIIQAVAAVFIAIGALFTVFRHKIAALLKKNTKVEKKEIHIVEDEEDLTEK